MIKRLMSFFQQHKILFFLLLFAFILRIPNFYEPYWYGDEAIYLVVGNGINKGLKLYTDIIDHKTPIIYYLATTPNQFYFRMLNVAWMLTTTCFFYFFAKNIFKKNWSIFIATIIFILFTTLPMLEGNIPNGELFVMGFVMTGALILSKTSFFQSWIKAEKGKKESKTEIIKVFVAGVFIGLGILTKVPGLFDLFAFLAVGWFMFFSLPLFSKNNSDFKNNLLNIIAKTLILFSGAIFPIFLSIIYYILIGSGRDYFDYGLVYNFRYSGSWTHNFNSELIAKFFTLPGKSLVLTIILLVLTFSKKLISSRFQFLASWFALTLFASLLSNRPYPHYFLQIIPSLALIIGHLVESVFLTKKNLRIFEIFIVVFLIMMMVFVKNTLGFSTYPTISYYEKFLKLKTSQISKEKYDQSFNWLIKENNQVAQIIDELDIKEMFIWGTNPLLYAQTKTIPTSRFTVSFHIKDFDDYDRTFSQIQKSMPKLIVMMKNEQTKFADLERLLEEKYELKYQFPSMDLYLLP